MVLLLLFVVIARTCCLRWLRRVAGLCSVLFDARSVVSVVACCVMFVFVFVSCCLVLLVVDVAS